MEQNLSISFRSRRLEMSHGERFFVRVLGHAAYGILGSAALIFSFSDVVWLRSFGILITLFLIDAIYHINKGYRSLESFWHDGHVNESVNAYEYASPHALRIVEIAFEQSGFTTTKSFTALLAARLTQDKHVVHGLVRAGIDPTAFSEKAYALMKQDSTHVLSKAEHEIALIMIAAMKHAIAYRRHYIEPEDIFAALFVSRDEQVQKLLHYFSLQKNSLENSILLMRRSRETKRFHIRNILREPRKIRHITMNRAWTARPTSILDTVSDDITDLARASKHSFFIGHRKELQILIDALAKEGNRNAMLIGDVGVGKNALVEHLALLIIEDRVPKELLDKRIVRLSLARLLAGTDTDEAEQKVRAIIQEIRRAGNCILFIPDIHLLSRAGGRLSIAEFMLPLITDSAVPVIGATLPQEFHATLERVSEFSESFEIVRLEEISPEDAARLLAWRASYIESLHGVLIGYRAIEESIKLAKRYFRNRMLPGSAEALLGEAAVYAASRKEKHVEADAVIAVAERKSNIPIHEAERHESDKLLLLEERIKKHIVGQDAAVRAIARVMREYRAGLSHKKGPIASFLFVGPTGVGKTELAKVLAAMQFGSESQMIRFDMSEYQTLQSVERLIGGTDGIHSGTLVDAVREKPYSLILLDEFEKAHPNILNIFLQVLDDGRLTDSMGRTAHFEDTLIIATSNAHSDFIEREIQKEVPYEELDAGLKHVLTDVFRIELLNRFSGIITFQPLSNETLVAIVRLHLNELSATLKETHNISLEYNDALVGELAKRGYNPTLGARPLRRAIEEYLRGPIAEKILKGELQNGGSVHATYTENGFSLTS